jgi:Universal stress protein family
MTILFAYDGSENADAAIAGSASLLGGRENAEAVVLTVWEPLVVEAVRTMRFGGSVPPIPTNVAEVDDSAEEQAKQLAEHGARLAGERVSTPVRCGSRTIAGSQMRSSRAPRSSTRT